MLPHRFSLYRVRGHRPASEALTRFTTHWRARPFPNSRLRAQIVARNSSGGVATSSASLPALSITLRSGGARGRRWARLSSRSVARKPSTLCAVASSQVTPAGPPATTAPIRRRSPSLKVSAGATLAHRRTRAPLRRAAMRVSQAHSRPRDRTPQRTGALATAEGQPHRRGVITKGLRDTSSQKPFVFNQSCGGEDRIRTGV